MTKYIKFTILGLFAAVTLLFLFANLRQASPTEKLKPVSLATFDLHGALALSSSYDLQEKLKQTIGVTACRVSCKGKIASVVYHPDVVNIQSLREKIVSVGFSPSIKTFEKTASGCPVHGWANSLNRFVSMFDLR
jgi:hypothetical protein